MISFRTQNFMYSYNKMQPRSFSTHLHRYYEFLYFVKGDATYIVEGCEYPAEDGDLFVTMPGELHSIAFKTDRDYERHFIQISEEFLSDLNIDLLSLLRHKTPGENNKISGSILDKTEIERCFSGVQENVVNRTTESDILIKSYIIQLICRINSILPSAKTVAVKENERVKCAKEYINSHLTDSLTLDKIAEEAFTDKYYLSHLFKKETGITMTDYINVQRIALAKKLISQGGSASKIFSECGFSDYSSFYRTFKRLSGKSPTQFFKK